MRCNPVMCSRPAPAASGRTSLIGEHALPNAMIPTVTAIGFRAAAALGLTFTVEVVFNINGMGTLLTNAIQTRNVTVLQGSMLVVGIVVLFVNLLVDISYGLLNPKVRLENGERRLDGNPGV